MLWPPDWGWGGGVGNGPRWQLASAVVCWAFTCMQRKRDQTALSGVATAKPLKVCLNGLLLPTNPAGSLHQCGLLPHPQ
jgi:hypothetical protein